MTDRTAPDPRRGDDILGSVRTLRSTPVLAVIGLVVLSCGPGGGDESALTVTTRTADPPTSVAVESHATTGATTSVPGGSEPSSSSPELAVELPEVEPIEAGFEVVALGTGPAVTDGDVVFLAWEMVAFDTGETVESTTADFGGPVPIEIGAGAVPRALDAAVAGQPIGTTLQVEFPIGMGDLPGYLDPTRAYVVRVHLVELAEPEENTISTTTLEPRPTTTVAGPIRVVVAATGPLAVDWPGSDELPAANSVDVVSSGAGRLTEEGDELRLDYLVVSWTTGEVVWSTADRLGGPRQVTLGAREIPRLLESAVFRQPVGTRLQVVYAPGLPDLPPELPADDAYVVAVDILP